MNIVRVEPRHPFYAPLFSICLSKVYIFVTIPNVNIKEINVEKIMWMYQMYERSMCGYSKLNVAKTSRTKFAIVAKEF